MKNKEQSDAITSGHVGPKLTGLGRAPTSGVCGLWPQRHCLPLNGTPENGAKKRRLCFSYTSSVSLACFIAWMVASTIFNSFSSREPSMASIRFLHSLPPF